MRSSRVILLSFFLTVLIFATGILINYGLDFLRLDAIAGTMTDHEIDAAGYRLQEAFADMVGGDRCSIMEQRIAQLKSEIQDVGRELGSYSGFSFFKKKDFDYLKRKYFLLEMQFYTLLESLNKDCHEPYMPILFFYRIDDPVSERQGYTLEDLSKAYERNVVVLSFDKDYEDEPLVGLLRQRFGIDTAPTIIINGEKREGEMFLGELNATVLRWLRRADQAARDHDFTYTPISAGIDPAELDAGLAAAFPNATSFAKGDILLVRGRLAGNASLICAALEHYDEAARTAQTGEERALLHETVASLGCGRNIPAWLRMAAEEWRAINASWRADALGALADGRFLPSIEPLRIEPNLNIAGDGVTLGGSTLMIRPGDSVISQVDRVTRDWLGEQLPQDPDDGQILTTFSERLRYNETELRADIGWHEGAIMRDLAALGASTATAVGTMAVRDADGGWYAPDETGVFRFEVPLDKVLYPTTRFLREDVAIIIDTHGINMLVEQSLRNQADVVIGCCDHPGKIAAAAYLSERNVSVICPPDKFAYLALGNGADLYPSPPMRVENGTAIFGGRPISLARGEKVVAVNATSLPYALWYYQTPAAYFSTLGPAAGLSVTYVTIDGFGQLSNVTRVADRLGADVIGVRVFNSQDYNDVAAWLRKDASRRAVLFHSAPYPYGKLLFRDFPAQTTFGDVNPIIG